MRLIRLYLAVVLGLVSLDQASGKFALFETRQVPIARVFKNLQLRLEKNTNDLDATYCLARLHSMAYATNLAEISVRKDNSNPVLSRPWESDVPLSVQTFTSLDTRNVAFEHLTN